MTTTRNTLAGRIDLAVCLLAMASTFVFVMPYDPPVGLMHTSFFLLMAGLGPTDRWGRTDKAISLSALVWVLTVTVFSLMM